MMRINGIMLSAALLMAGGVAARQAQAEQAPAEHAAGAEQAGAQKAGAQKAGAQKAGAQQAGAQQAGAAQPDAAAGSPAGEKAADKLVLLFATGTDVLDARDQAILDQASRLYRDGRPIIMTVSGSTDSVGDATRNLLLSQRRADAVARGMRERGIPAERTQILAKGETSPAVQAPAGTAEPQNRRVEITWR